MYYEYWGLKKPPFDNVPDPSMYVDAHESVENTVAESLFAIEEGNECIAVIVGDVGLGKTLSLRLILDSLPPEKYRVAFITNPDMSFIQLMREIVGQLTGAQCEVKSKMALLETFNRLIFETADEGKKVLIFIDEANALAPANLESLRLLTNMQDDNRNLFTILLAGQMELARRLEHPKRANLFQRVGTYSRIEKIKSEAMVKTYVETRLRLAGAERSVFTEDAFPVLWEYSEYGVPRLLNKLCKLSLKAGETNGLQTVDQDVVKQIGERFQKMTGPATTKRKPRREQPIEEAAKMEQPEQDAVKMEQPVREEEPVMASPVMASPVMASPVTVSPETVPSVMESPETVVPAVMAPAAVELPVMTPEFQYAPPPQETTETDEAVFDDAAPAAPESTCHDRNVSDLHETDEIDINGIKVLVTIPPEIMEEALGASPGHRDRLAGVLAARTLEQNPQINSPASKDPVAIWGAIRDFILMRLEEHREAC